MIRHLITATLVATAPLNTTAGTNRSLYLNNYTPVEYTETYGQTTIEGVKYLCKPQNNTTDLGILQASVNSSVDITYNANANQLTNEVVFICKLENINESTDTNSVYVDYTKQIYLQYNESLITSCSYTTMVLKGSYDYEWDYDPKDNFDEFTEVINIENYDLETVYEALYDTKSLGPSSPAFKSYETYTGNDAINKWKQPYTHEYSTVLSAGQYDYYILMAQVVYNVDGQIITKDTTMRTVNPLNVGYTWTVPAQTGEIVDIPGLMFTMLGMPFAFISQAFNLTVFPGTMYEVNLTHVFMAIVVAGILIFILKKVIK